MKISPFLAEVKVETQTVNTRVKRTVRPSRSFIEEAQYRTIIDKIGSRDAKIIVTNAVHLSIALLE
jgi:hypothetical protein